MSEENVEVVRRLVAAWNRQDADAILALTHPEVEYVNAPMAVEPGTRRGMGDVAAVVRKQWEALSGARMEIDRIDDRGDEIITVTHVSRFLPDSETRIDNPLLTSWGFRDGLVSRIEQLGGGPEFPDALKAVGLSDAIPGSNAELVRRWVEAVNERDPDTSLALCDPSFEMTEAEALPGAARVSGLEALQSYFRGWQRNWSEWNWQIDELTELDGDRVLLVSRLWLRGLRGGTPVEREWSYLFEVRDGKLLRQDGFGSREEALGAASRPADSGG